MSPEQVLDLFEKHGGDFYAEDVSQVDHAVQSALLAVANGSKRELVLAALLHDVGHLMHLDALGNDESHFQQDLRHETVAADALIGDLPPSVTEPIRMHVAAKRWLCANEQAYFAQLSEASKQSLEFQGGSMTKAECSKFEGNPWFADAVQLRRWDDEAKVVGLVADPMQRFRELLLTNWL